MTIGEKIAELRTDGGMSQQTLADMLFVSRDLVSKWENDTRRPCFAMIEKIAHIYNVPVETIIEKDKLVFDELTNCIPRDAIFSEDEFARVLNSFLHDLSCRRADVFLKRYYFQKSIAEISTEYGIGENHVTSMLSKTRKKLKKYLEENSNG